MAYTTLNSLLTAIAEAIRNKKGTTAKINAQNFPSEINSILKGSGNASPSDVLSGKTFTNNDGEQTGAMPNRGAWGTNINPGESATIPVGYHNGGGKVIASSISPTSGVSRIVKGSTASLTVYSKILCICGFFGMWDWVSGTDLQIKVNGSWVNCNSSNGIVAETGIGGSEGLANGRFLRGMLWYNSGQYKDSVIEEIWCGRTDNDSAVCIEAIKG